jgi:hypothetical protein
MADTGSTASFVVRKAGTNIVYVEVGR